jgi:hypothetical protein
VNLQELNTAGAGDASGFAGLLLKRGKKGLEPLEGVGVLANPDELNTAETRRRVRPISQVPDVLENGSPRCDTNTSSDQDSDFVLKHVLGGGSVGSIDAEAGHGLAVLKSDFVHSHGIDTLVQLGLGTTSTNRVTQVLGEVTNLSHVD